MTTITLTFDNGPDPEVTPFVLRTLKAHDIRTTFFVIGEKLRDRRRLCEQAHGEGHWIGNHTFNHLLPLGRCREPGTAVREIVETEALIGDLVHPRKFFRPFGNGGDLTSGLLNREALEHLCTERYSCVLWNAVPEDWIYPSGWVERALALCQQQEYAVLVLHDLPTGAMDHLDSFIELAIENGMTFTQDFPSECLPIDEGAIIGDVGWLLGDDRSHITDQRRDGGAARDG